MPDNDEVKVPSPEDWPSPCSIPRAMMLEITREQELRELREEQEYRDSLGSSPLPGTK